MCTISHILIWYFMPFLAMLVMGTALALSFATIWTAIIYVIKPEEYGKAFATIIALDNIGFTIIPLIIGALRTYTQTYYYG